MNYAFLRRRWLDFRHGHSLYLIFILSFANFILIFHRLLIERVEFLNDIFSNLWVFVIAFIGVYIPTAIFIGVWHRRTQMRVESEQVLRHNPVMAKYFRMLIDIIEKQATQKEINDFRNFLFSIEQGKGGKVEDRENPDE